MTFSFDETMMAEALALARKGQGWVEPNPMVGAVIVQGQHIVGRGWHQKYGGPHAEIHALQETMERARGATLYVSLEPCCHHGKTPPCTEALIQAGIKRVVAAMPDPFPQVAGQGLQTLKNAGIEVVSGVLQPEAQRLNQPFLKLLRTGLPYVIAKWAMTLDGRIATATGESKWISCPESRARVHQLRGRTDALIVGVGTVLADDPLLTARPPGARIATRIVLDTHLRIPMDSQLVKTAAKAPLIIFHTTGDAQKVQTLTQAGCECLSISSSNRLESCKQLLTELGKRRMTNVLVEGGPTVLGRFFDGHFVDEIWAFIAPKWIGSAMATGPLAGQGIEKIAQAGELDDSHVEQIGCDVLIRGRTRYRLPGHS